MRAMKKSTGWILIGVIGLSGGLVSASAQAQVGGDCSTVLSSLRNAVIADDLDRVQNEVGNLPSTACLNQGNVIGETVLMLAAYYANPDIVRLLLFMGADPNIQAHVDGVSSENGEQTALMETCYSRADATRLTNTRWALLNAKGIRLDQAEHLSGRTVLGSAVATSGGDPSFVSDLLDFADKHHLDVNINAKYFSTDAASSSWPRRVTALEDAQNRGYALIAQLLRNYGASH